MSQGKAKPREIRVDKMMGSGLTNSTLPSYIDVGQRHFEKEKPIGLGDHGAAGVRIYTLPVDLLALTLPADMVEGIESVEMVYRKKT